MTRLSDTEALVRQGIRRPGGQYAPVNNSSGGADNVSLQTAGQFRKETGAGPEGMKEACAELEKSC